MGRHLTLPKWQITLLDPNLLSRSLAHWLASTILCVSPAARVVGAPRELQPASSRESNCAVATTYLSILGKNPKMIGCAIISSIFSFLSNILGINEQVFQTRCVQQSARNYWMCSKKPMSRMRNVPVVVTICIYIYINIIYIYIHIYYTPEYCKVMNLFLKNGKISEEVMFDSISFGKNRWISKKDRYGHMFATQTSSSPKSWPKSWRTCNCCAARSSPSKRKRASGKRDTLQNQQLEPENHLFEKEGHLPNLLFWVPCYFSDTVGDWHFLMISHPTFLVLTILMVFHFVFMVKKVPASWSQEKEQGGYNYIMSISINRFMICRNHEFSSYEN